MKSLKQLVARARARGLEPFQHENHAYPLTRRQLISQGFTLGGGLLITPSLLSYAGKAYAEGTCGDPSADMAVFRATPKLMVFEAPGGLSAGANLFVGGQGGYQDRLPDAGYGRMSVSNQWVKEEPDVDTFGIPLWKRGGFYLGLMRGTTPEVRAKMSGFTACARSIDDNAGNPFSPVYWAHRAGFQGALAPIIGSQETVNGARSLSPLSSILGSVSATQINGVGDARNLLEALALSQALPGRLDKIIAAAAQLSEAQLKRLSGKALPDQIAELVRCNYIKSAKGAGQNLADSIDFSKNAAFLAALNATNDPALNPPVLLDGTTAVPFTANANLGQGEEAQVLQMAYMLASGFAGAATYVGDGVDYHDNPRGTCNQRDFNYGYRMGLAFTAAHYLATTLGSDAGFYVIFHTDGSAGCSDNTARQDTSAQAMMGPNPTNDQGESSMMCVLGLHRKGRIPIQNPLHQINSMNGNGGVDSNNPNHKVIADSPEKAMLSLMQNIAWAEGIDVAKLSADVLPESFRIWGAKPV